MNRTGATTALLGGVMEPLGRCLTAESAREILALRSAEEARRRVAELADKCNAGTLTPEERAEYQLAVSVGEWVALLQAKARRFLADHPTA